VVAHGAWKDGGKTGILKAAESQRRYMRGVFDDEDREVARPRGDRELTLGSWTLLSIFFGLVLLCGLCFGLGYALGSRGASKGPVFQSQPPAAGPGPQTSVNTPQGKPSAAAQPPAAPQTMDGTQPAGAMPATDGGTATGAPAGTAPGATPGTAQAQAAPMMGTATTAATPNGSGWHAVQPAMPGATGGMPTPQPAAVTRVQPVMTGQGAPLMVQIAAVSNQEDANVLLGALRRRGYAASAVHNPADNLIHVCIGPFNNRNDANSMRNKLLNDGYNAIVLP
jgi:DedD protein